VPPNPESIQVIGAVYNQSAYLYKPDKDFSYYIGMSGGLTKSAEEKEIYILKVNGRAMKPKQGSLFWSSSSHRWSSGYVKLEPGDTIVVPEELDKVAWLRDIKDITQIMFQIATSAGVFLVAF
jgi:protein involved in polysaccharide export with SLBB domain